MQNQTTPLILTFGVADPVGASGVQTDVAAFAALGCHALSVVTGLLISDTTKVEDIQETDADWVADQARLLLEDMRISAIKVGALSNLAQAAVVAEIASDYPDVPLILDPFLSGLPDSGLHDDDMLTAIRQILVPQASVLLLSQVELARMAETWREGAGDMVAADCEELIDAGCEFVLVKCSALSRGTSSQPATGGSAICNALYGDQGLAAEYQWQHLPGPFLGAGSTLAAALAALMARGLPAEDAIAASQDYIAGALAHAQRLGMGKLVPNKFWGYRVPDLAPLLAHAKDATPHDRNFP